MKRRGFLASLIGGAVAAKVAPSVLAEPSPTPPLYMTVETTTGYPSPEPDPYYGIRDAPYSPLCGYADNLQHGDRITFKVRGLPPQFGAGDQFLWKNYLLQIDSYSIRWYTAVPYAEIQCRVLPAYSAWVETAILSNRLPPDALVSRVERSQGSLPVRLEMS